MLRTFKVTKPLKWSKLYKIRKWWFGVWCPLMDADIPGRRYKFPILCGADQPRRCCHVGLGIIQLRISFDVPVFWHV